MAEWQPIETAPEGVEVETKSYGRSVRTLVRFGALWFVDRGRSSYVYYTPDRWRPARQEGAE